MSKAEHLARAGTVPLVAGQRLDRATFHERYEAMPPGTRAELIGGVVHLPSPVGGGHGRGVAITTTWLGTYESRTPGVEALGNATAELDDLGEPQPDAMLLIQPECGGQTRNDRGYVAGAPELVVEVSRATRFIDLGPKRVDYERAGVREYVVRALEPDEVIWHELREGRLVAVDPGQDGLYRSVAFPGLWLDPRALMADDVAGVLAALERGLAAPEHAAFAARLAAARKTS